jgi:phospho-N-acetylmuramoyl-pentapeptide-transferase
MLYFLFVDPGPLGGLPAANVFRYISARTAWGMLTSLILAYAVFPWFIEWMKQKRIDQIIRTDGPESHLLSKGGTPTMGGVVILGAVAVSTLLWGRLDVAQTWLVLVVMAGYGLIGFVDDWKKVMYRDPAGLAGRWKILGQVVFGGGPVLYAFLSGVAPATLSVPFVRGHVLDFSALWVGAPWLLGLLWVAFGVFVLTAMSNGVNLTDGLDGLAIGPTMTSAATYGLVAYLVGNTRFSTYLGIDYVSGAGELSVIAFALVGGGLGFLWYNAYPAQVFMGDVGSLAIGGVLGMFCLLTKHELLMVVVGGIFVLESLSVVIQVVSFKTTGKRVFAMAPIHHHYEKLGWSEPKIIVRFWIISVVLALVALSTLKLR